MIADKEISTSGHITKEALAMILKKVQEETNEMLSVDSIAGLK